MIECLDQKTKVKTDVKKSIGCDNKPVYLMALMVMTLGLSACVSTDAQPKPPIKVAVVKPKINQVNHQHAQLEQNHQHAQKINITNSADEHHGHTHDIPKDVGTKADFEAWLRANPSQAVLVKEYERYLGNRLGEGKLVPLHELLTTARSWQACGHEPYQVPPQELWAAIIPTIHLFNDLRALGILPADTHIRSVYRNPDLNRCAGGAPSSKHMTNGAMDIWVPDFEAGGDKLYQLQNQLCQYWLVNGKKREFGLGLYATGAIHLDTQGYRKWGAQFSQADSICRYSPPKSDGGL